MQKNNGKRIVSCVKPLIAGQFNLRYRYSVIGIWRNYFKKIILLNLQLMTFLQGGDSFFGSSTSSN